MNIDKIVVQENVGRYSALKSVAEILVSVLDPKYDQDENLQDTPARVARFWEDWLSYSDDNLDSQFEGFEANQLIAATGIRVWSICAHHLLPFWCDVNIAYIANSHVIGLSKLARIAKLHGHKLQLQEKLVRDIADDLEKRVGPDVAVTAAGEHLCMTMRGIETEATIHSQVMRGAFLENETTRSEFLNL